jgi:hypothetical protein
MDNSNGPGRTEPAGTPIPDMSDLASALAPFLIDGPGGECVHGSFTAVATPAALARMFADLAARLAALPADALPFLPSVGITVQPHCGDEQEERQMVFVDEFVAMLAPAAQAQRSLMSGGTVHYNARVDTPAGLTVAVLGGVTPNEAERAEYARQQAERAEYARQQAERAEHARTEVQP